MAMMLLSPAMLASTSAVAGTCLLPAAQEALRVFSRSSSFMSLTAPTPLQKKTTGNNKDASPTSSNTANTNTAFSWTFAPLARELTRSAGGFEQRAHWPVPANGSTLLLDLHLDGGRAACSGSTATGFNFGLAYARRFSSLPNRAHAQELQQQDKYNTSAAGVIELPEELQQPAAAQAGLLATWFPKAQPRLKGFSRKLLLRQVNRKIIARVARRFTIGIPVLGFYFVSKLVMKDMARVKNEVAAGQYAVAALFSTAVVADVLDLTAQMTIISGLAHSNLGVGLAGAAALLVAADHASLATAALSFSCGLGGELLALKRAGELAGGNSSE